MDIGKSSSVLQVFTASVYPLRHLSSPRSWIYAINLFYAKVMWCDIFTSKAYGKQMWRNLIIFFQEIAFCRNLLVNLEGSLQMLEPAGKWTARGKKETAQHDFLSQAGSAFCSSTLSGLLFTYLSTVQLWGKSFLMIIITTKLKASKLLYKACHLQNTCHVFH